MEPNLLAWSILLLPLLVATVILFFLRNAGGVAGFLATASALITLVFAVMLAHPELRFSTDGAEAPHHEEGHHKDAASEKGGKKDDGHGHAEIDLIGDSEVASYPWINLGEDVLKIDIGLKIDKLSAGMMLIVTFIGFLVHLFSLGYMKGDEGLGRYFGALALFMFSMTGIVLADNFVMMFIFWELVGVSSYLLISHWYTKPSAADAAKKAFLTNRIGDFGFMLGILILWKLCGHFSFDGIQANYGEIKNDLMLNVAVLLIFCGALGKSAQAPLHVWLPDAMEGPTPVSALIHAATMVAAGVFMMARIGYLVAVAEIASYVIICVGAATALIAALIALQQSDIKKILAYSTLSQLGYMIMAQGCGTYGSEAGMFHLYTHAFFKALLFLGSGAVIYACHHEQNIWKMGGLLRRMPITTITFAIGTAALIAVPLTSGFWSKEHILHQALETGHIYGQIAHWVGLFVALLTPFYMTRLFIVAFLGKPKSQNANHALEVSPVMFVPLVLLTAVSLFSVYLGVPEWLLAQHSSVNPIGDFAINITSICSMGALVIGVLAALVIYRGKDKDPITIAPLRDKFYIDELYQKIVLICQDLVGKLFDILDRYLVEGIVAKLPAGLALGAGIALRRLQAGNLQSYAFFFAFAVLLLIFILIF